MKNISKFFMAFASLILLLVFLFPIWKIDLSAPQYPEGLGLRIWVNQITGMKDGDLNLINNLNHYIGMKTIQPESISELKVMPFIIIFFSILGLFITFINKQFMKYAWLILFIVVLIVGLYDYYMWGYDYGHNLNPNAPIKVPGMTYQPPLLGSKQLLNMNATSLPDIGSFILGLSILFVILSIYFNKKVQNEK
ncbi:MAG: hypothetical protein AB1695_01380 [Stygiobacter sp.]|jgi:copper chaperone NosL